MKKMKISFESQLHRQRLALGIICGMLPIACFVFNLPAVMWCEWDSSILGSISATFWSPSAPFMIAGLGLASFFFFTYKGHDRTDNILTTISATSALGVVAFPTWLGIMNFAKWDCMGVLYVPAVICNYLHMVSAAVLFLSFAAMIFFQFTKGKDKRRNLLYRACAVLICIFTILIALTSHITPFLPDWLALIWVWLNEFLMLEAFAVAWIVKSKALAIREVKNESN